jgi:hypothetical protein
MAVRHTPEESWRVMASTLRHTALEEEMLAA